MNEKTGMDAFDLSKIITDEYSAKILVATFNKPRSANELSDSLGIPIAACYRRINTLKKHGLLLLDERALTQKGKRVSLFRSNLKNAYIFLENGKLRVKFELLHEGKNIPNGWNTQLVL